MLLDLSNSPQLGFPLFYLYSLEFISTFPSVPSEIPLLPMLKHRDFRSGRRRGGCPALWGGLATIPAYFLTFCRYGAAALESGAAAPLLQNVQNSSFFCSFLLKCPTLLPMQCFLQNEDKTHQKYMHHNKTTPNS